MPLGFGGSHLQRLLGAGLGKDLIYNGFILIQISLVVWLNPWPSKSLGWYKERNDACKEQPQAREGGTALVNVMVT